MSTSPNPPLQLVPVPEAPESVEVRLMDPEEAPALAKVPPFSQVGLPDLTHTKVVIVQGRDTGAIYGYWMIFDAVHVEPLWIHPSYRKNPSIARRLWNGVKLVLQAAGAPIAFGIISHADMPKNAALAQKLGFRELPGKLFCIEVPPYQEKGKKDGEG